MTTLRPDEGSPCTDERYRALIAALAGIVWTTDVGGQIIEDQPAWRAYTGQAREEVLNAGWLAAVHPDTREKAVAAWAHAVSQGVTFETEWRLRRHDGQYRCFSVHAAPVRGKDGAIREWIGCSIDITRRKQREEELARLHAKAHDALIKLERRGREMQILKNLSDTLQACNSREEAYPFIALAATELFPGAWGALAVPAPAAREWLETATEWGKNPLDKGEWMKLDFAMEDCWGLRRGAMHEPGAGTVCRHFQLKPHGPYACVPLAVRGEVSGLLSMRLAGAQRLDEEQRSVLAMFGNAVALALSTLQLREAVQQHPVRGR